MNILVFGGGAMGSVFGGFLSRENDVTLIGRKKHVDMINEKGLLISGIWGEHRFRKIRAAESLADVQQDASFNLIMITVKSFDTSAAAEAIRPFVGAETAVMSMQNGIGNEDILSKAVGAERTIGGMAIFGARLLEPGHAEVTVYASPCRVGEISSRLNKRAKNIAAIFSEAGIPTEPSDNIMRDKWMKAFYNIALNPLSAILRVPYGEVVESEDAKEIMKAMLKEAFSVAGGLGIRLEFTCDEYFNYLLEKQLPPTASHISSMLQDIERGRQTEIDYLNGAIARLGKKQGIETPVNETITRYINGLSSETGATTQREMLEELVNLSREAL